MRLGVSHGRRRVRIAVAVAADAAYCFHALLPTAECTGVNSAHVPGILGTPRPIRRGLCRAGPNHHYCRQCHHREDQSCRHDIPPSWIAASFKLPLPGLPEGREGGAAERRTRASPINIRPMREDMKPRAQTQSWRKPSTCRELRSLSRLGGRSSALFRAHPGAGGTIAP